MIKHEEIKKIFDKALYYEDKMTGDKVAWYLINKGYKIKNVDVYIKQCEATEHELSTCKVDCGTYKMLYQELQRDVIRFLQLNDPVTLMIGYKYKEWEDLRVKLLKKCVDVLSSINGDVAHE